MLLHGEGTKNVFLPVFSCGYAISALVATLKCILKGETPVI